MRLQMPLLKDSMIWGETHDLYHPMVFFYRRFCILEIIFAIVLF